MKEFGYSEQVCDFSVRGVQVWHFWFMHYLRSGMGHKRRECVSDPRHVDGVSHVKMGSVCVLGVADAILSSNTLSGPSDRPCEREDHAMGTAVVVSAQC